MKAVVNVISIIIISGIIVSLVGASYMWSVPLINKQQDNTAFQAARTFVLNLNDRIIDIANEGSGEDSIDIPMGAVTIVSHDATDPRNNSLVFEIPFAQPLAFESTKTYIGGTNYLDVLDTTKGVFGESSPSIITMEVSALGSNHMATFQTLFRELVTKTTPAKRFKISLNKGSSDVKSANGKVIISYDGIVTENDVTYTKINIDVV